MPSFHNIEKSAFHKGEYVGYAAGTTWRITKVKDLWYATPRDETILRQEGRRVCATLTNVSLALERLNNEYQHIIKEA